MQKVIKTVFFAASALSVIVLIAVALITAKLPDEFYVCEREICSVYYYEPGVSVVPAKPSISVQTSTQAEFSPTRMADVKFWGIFPIKTVEITSVPRQYVVPAGTPFGIKMYADGVLVVSVSEVECKNGSKSPGKSSGLREGDIIKSIDGNDVYKTEDVALAVERSKGNALDLDVSRNGKRLQIKLVPEYSPSQGCYKAGIWVRDSCAGIGTMTFYNNSQKLFAGLGHAVCDTDTGDIVEIKSGEIVGAEITGIYKSVSGTPGELCGVFSHKGTLGSIELNCETGVYGKLQNAVNSDEIPVAFRHEIKTGKAQILSTIDGEEPQYYDVEIIKINLNDSSNQKNMVIKVTDAELLGRTGGIVQGMSGSPIIQDGMLIGAVTHVFVNNPVQGYAIFAENMIKTSERIAVQGFAPAA